MRIAQFTDCLTDTGVTAVIRNLTQAFTLKGHVVETFVWSQKNSTSVGVSATRIQIEGLPKPTKSLKGKVIRVALGQRLYEYFHSSFFCKQVKAQVALEKFDVILIHGLACIPLRQLKGNTVVIAHNTKSKILLSKRMPIFHLIQKYIYGSIYKNHPVIAVSAGVKEDLATYFSVSRENMRTIYNPFPIEMIRKKSLENEVLVPKNFVLAVGRTVKAKRFDRLMRVYRESGIKSELVVMIGNGKPKKILRQAKKYGVEHKVKIIGFQENPYPFMRNAKVLALTSDFEGLPTVIIESLICGTPVVATDCPSGPSEILGEDLPDCLIPIQEEGRFAKQLKLVHEDPKNFPIPDLSQFSSENVIEKYLDYFAFLGFSKANPMK